MGLQHWIYDQIEFYKEKYTPHIRLRGPNRCKDKRADKMEAVDDRKMKSNLPREQDRYDQCSGKAI